VGGERIDSGGGTCLTCEQIVAKHLRQKRKWTIRSAGAGSKGERTYAWAWIATASLAHYLLVRKHRTTGQLAFHYCFVPGDRQFDHRGHVVGGGRHSRRAPRQVPRLGTTRRHTGHQLGADLLVHAGPRRLTITGRGFLQVCGKFPAARASRAGAA
jgi:hypothetical protein